MTNVSKNTKALAPWAKIAISGGILLGGAAIIGTGAFAVFTSSSTATARADAGAIELDLTNSNITVENIKPGDTVQQLLPFSFTNGGNDGDLVTAIDLSVAASSDVGGTNKSAVGTNGYYDLSGGKLFAGSIYSAVSETAYPDGTHNLGAESGSSALTYSIRSCTEQWSTGDAGYTCAGTETITKAAGDTLNSIPLNSGLALTPSSFGLTGDTFASDAETVNLYSMIAITLPATANNSFMNASVALTFNATAVQRGATTTAK